MTTVRLKASDGFECPAYVSQPMGKPKGAVMAHYAKQDHWIGLDTVESFAKAHPEVTVHLYEADHGFNCDHRGSYQKASADLARERTLAFFDEHLA